MTHLSANPPTDSVSVRRYLCDALRIDLVGPRSGDAALQHERLPQAPSRWYLTGFLAPGDAPEEQLAQDSEEALEMRRSKGWPEAERDAVKVADVAMVEWSEGKETEFLMAGLAASWPDERTAPVDAVVRAFRERMVRMAGARLEMTGERLLNLAHGERDLATRIEETRARLPEKTRAAETRERRYRAAAAIGR